MASFLGGAMRALRQSDKTRKFVDTLDYAHLKPGWSSDPEIIRLASDAWEDMGIQSPFFRAYYRNSKLIGPDGLPLPMYHGSGHEGLEAIDPNLSRLVKNPEEGSAFAVSHPGTTLAYLMQPSKVSGDEGLYRLRENLKDALLRGESIRRLNAETGKTEFYHMSKGDFLDPDANADWHVNRLMKGLDDEDYRRNIRDLSFVHDAMRRHVPGYHVPEEDLRSAASSHHAYQRLIEDNDDVLPQEVPFAHPAMGQIYPVYVNAERPLVVSGDGRPGMRDWFRVGDMTLDRKYLFPEEIERLDSLPVNVRDALQGTDTPRRLYPRVDYSGNATDNLSAYLRAHTDHDALISRGVYDGGGHDVEPATVVAVHSPNQMKDAFRNVGTFDPGQRSMLRVGVPAASGGALAAAMGASSPAEARLRERDLPVQEAWNPLESLALAPVGALSAAGAAGSFLADAAMGLAPDLPEVPEEYYEAAQ